MTERAIRSIDFSEGQFARSRCISSVYRVAFMGGLIGGIIISDSVDPPSTSSETIKILSYGISFVYPYSKMLEARMGESVSFCHHTIITEKFSRPERF